MKNNYPVLFLLVLLLSAPAFSQQIIKGMIIDKMSNSPLQYAIVQGRLNGRAVITDKQGHFQIFLPAGETSIDVSLIGYHSRTIVISTGINTLLIALERGTVDLAAVTITPQSINASFHTISGIDLNLRPVNSAQDLLRLVPGLFLGEHHGGGIAEHIFFRGFDADHGTDVNVSVDDVPVNLVSQAHGQGFSDLHFLIPELVTSYEFGKGPYYTDKGDFTTAGYVAFHTAEELDKNIVKMEGGQFRTGRIMAMLNLINRKVKKRGASAYVSGEGNYSDGPFEFPQHLSRINLFGKYNVNISSKDRLTVTLSTFSSRWRSSGSIPQRAVDEGLISRFGYIDSLQGGNTGRTGVVAKLVSTLSDRVYLENQAYYSHYYFDHHYDDTFFAEDSINGDQLKQHEYRDQFGYNEKLTQHAYFKSSVDLNSSVGLGWQLNKIYNSELSHTVNKNTILNLLQLGNIDEICLNAYLDENLRAGNWLFNGGIRMDRFYFNYEDKLNSSMPSRIKIIASPKFNIEYTHNRTIQFYFKGGKGFHSNNAKVVVGNLGQQILPAAYGTDLGINWKPFNHLFVNVAVWYLHLQQEFVYNGDKGTLEPGDKTRRAGIDFSARYQLAKWLFAIADINLSKARDIQAPRGSDYVPLAVPLSSTGGFDFKFAQGLKGGISYRYMKDRPANQDGSLIAKGYFVNDLTTYFTNRKYEIGIEIQNLFNVRWREEQFEVRSRLKNEQVPVDEVNFTAGTPFFAKLKFSIFF